MAASLLLSGCTFLQLAYDKAEWIVTRRIDSYFDLNSAQRDRLAPSLGRHTQWFKGDGFDAGLRLLMAAERKIADGLTREEFNEIDAETKAWWKSIYMRVSGDAAHFIHNLSRAQLERAAEKFAESDENLEELLAEDLEDFPEEYEDYFEKVYDYYAKYVGDLTPGQKRLIWRERSRTRAQLVERLEMRRHFRKSMLTAVARAKSAPELQRMFAVWAHDPDAAAGPAYRAHRQREDTAWQAFVLKFDRTLTKDQREHAVAELRTWIRRLREIER